MYALPTDNAINSPSPNAQPDFPRSDSEVFAVLQECQHRSLAVGVVLCRQLEEGMCALEEAAQAAEAAGPQYQQQRRSSDGTTTFKSSSGHAEECNDSQMNASADVTDPERELSLFIPTVEDSEADDGASQVDDGPAPAPNAFEYSLGRIMNNWGKNRIGIHSFTPAASTGRVEKGDEMFPCPSGRWECGTFLGKRVYVEANNAFLGRGSLAVVLGGTIVVADVVNGVERRLASFPVAIKEVVYDARQKAVRSMLALALQFRLEVNHPGFVHIYHTGGYYPPFSSLSTTEKVPIYSHISLACSTTGSIADVLKRRGPFPMAEIQRCMAELLSTLQFMHDEARWVHNDVKSHNILIFDAPSILSNYKYQLTDFTGIARARTFAEVMRDVQNGLREQLEDTTVGGTAAFMSPESCLGLGMLPSNDIWSLGITAYHMATNTLPWKPLERQFPSMILNGYRCKYSLNTIFGKHGGADVGGACGTSGGSESENPLHGADASDGDGRRSAGSSGASSLSTSSSAGSAVLREKYAEFKPILEEFEQTILSDDFQDFVRQCLIENPLERPTATQLREHPFVKGIPVGACRSRSPTPLPNQIADGEKAEARCASCSV